MNILNQVKLSLEGFEKCYVHCDHDIPLGILYDFSCALNSFVRDQMAAKAPEKMKVTEEVQACSESF